MKKLNEEELSRVLTAHALGGLEVLRGWNDNHIYDRPGYPGCLVQVAFEISRLSELDGLGLDGLGSAIWFDCNYDPNWTVEKLLFKLEEQGYA